MKTFHGLKGIISGTFLIFGATAVMSPMNWHDIGLDILYIISLLIALMMILIGFTTLGEKPNENNNKEEKK